MEAQVLAQLHKGQDDGYGKTCFAKFLEAEVAQLRAKFIQKKNPYDRDRYVYEILFDKSKDLVSNTLGQIWSQKFEWDDIKKEILRLEQRMKVVNLKLEDIQPELDNLPWWRRIPPGFFKPLGQMKEMRKFLNDLALEHDELHKSVCVKRTLFNLATYKIATKLDQLEMTIAGGGKSIGGELQILLVVRQRDAIQANAIEYEKFHALFTEKVEPVREFIIEGRKWIGKVNRRINTACCVLCCVEVFLFILELLIIWGLERK